MNHLDYELHPAVSLVGVRDGARASVEHGDDPECPASAILTAAGRELEDRLAATYSSLFSVPEYFGVVEQTRPAMMLEMTCPEHLLGLVRQGRSVEVLNKVIDIDERDARRAVDAIFASMPDVGRIGMEVKFPPPPGLGGVTVTADATRAPARRTLRTLFTGTDHVVDHPDGPAAYLDALGSSTRRNLTKYANRLERRAARGVRRETVLDRDAADGWIDQIVEWNSARMIAKGQPPYYSEHPDVVAQLKQLAAAYGVVDIVYVGDEAASAYLSFQVGDDAWIYLGSFDRSFEREHLGLLGLYWTITAAADRGLRRSHLLWGDSVYKKRLGAVPVTAYRIAVYRRRLDSLVGGAAWRDIRAAWRLRLASWTLPQRLAYAVRRRVTRHPTN